MFADLGFELTTPRLKKASHYFRKSIRVSIHDPNIETRRQIIYLNDNKKQKISTKLHKMLNPFETFKNVFKNDLLSKDPPSENCLKNQRRS